MNRQKKTEIVDFSDLVGQKALVTGGSGGIGKAIALALGKAGVDVCVNYNRHEDRAREVVEEISKYGAESFYVRADVSNEQDVINMFRQAKEKFGFLDIVVSNAGIQADAAFQDMTLDSWNKVISINLTGQFLCAREAVRIFRSQGVRSNVSVSAGKIISICSVHDTIPWAGHVNYAASKGGISMLMKSVAQEVARHRIRVNLISPGAIRTNINTNAWKTAQAYEDLTKHIPYQRIGEPDEIGRAALWLASDMSDYVTGTTLYIDGGMMLYPEFESGG